MKFTRTIYLYSALDEFVLIYPLYALLFAAHGLSTGAISALLILWSVVAFVLEVPSGAWADKYSRRKLLALGQVLRAAGYLAWWLFPSAAGFAAGFVLWGIKSALSSGTFQALVYDELRATGEQARYVKVMGRAQAIQLAANLGATGLAAAVVLAGYTWVLLASAAACLVAAAVIATLPSAPMVRTTGERGYFQLLREGIAVAIRNPTVLKTVALFGFLGALYGVLDEYAPLFFKDAGVSTSLVPIGVAGLLAASIAGSALAHRTSRWTTPRHMLLLVLCGVLLFGAGTLMSIPGAVLLAGFIGLTRALSVVWDGRLQDVITVASRATVTSVGGFVLEVVGVGGYVLFGPVSEVAGRPRAFQVFGVIAIAVAVGVLSLSLREGRVGQAR